MLPVSINKPKIDDDDDDDIYVNYIHERKSSIDSTDTDDSYEPIFNTICFIENSKKENSSYSYYTYDLLNYLSSTPRIDKNISYKNINYIYYINNSLFLPFLQFYFPTRQEEEFPLCERKGSFVQDDCIYTFYEITNESMQSLNKNWLSFTVDEILNKNKAGDQVKKFIKKQQHVLFLKDEEGNLVETPVVAYYNKSTIISKSDPFSIMGPYYYLDVEERPNAKRFALFLGRLYVPMNFPKAGWDKSSLKNGLLRENDGTNKYYRHTIKISDHDGNWTHKYDSVYLGKLDLDDGGLLIEHSQWVVKSLEQFLLLE